MAGYTFSAVAFGGADFDTLSVGMLKPKNGMPVVPSFGGSTLRYRMRARDSVCVSQPSYVRWVALGTPDMTGQQCSAANLVCGSNPLTDLTDFCVEGRWSA
jgi:hypothetical protein